MSEMSNARNRIRAFGMLRNFADPEGYIPADLSGARTVAGILEILKSVLKARFPEFDPATLDECVVASETDILSLDSEVVPGMELAVLPPVCGG